MHYKSKKVNSNINNSGLPNLQVFLLPSKRLRTILSKARFSKCEAHFKTDM